MANAIVKVADPPWLPDVAGALRALAVLPIIVLRCRRRLDGVNHIGDKIGGCAGEAVGAAGIGELEVRL
jgi:hypothetical protein